MKKHSFTMVFLLILTLSLMGVVSANDNVTAADVDTPASLTQDEIQIDSDEYCHADDAAMQYCDSEVPDEEAEVITSLPQETVSCDELESPASPVGSVYQGQGVCEDISDGPEGDGDIEIPVSLGKVDIDPQEIDLDLDNDESYKFGYEITIAADMLFDFNCADDILVIATVGLIEIDNQTMKCLNGIINASDGYVSHGKGNIWTLSLMDTDSINVAFFIKKGECLNLTLFEYGNANPLYSGGVRPEISAGLWSNLEELSGSQSVSEFLDILSSWTNGQSDNLSLAACNHASTGLERTEGIRTLKNYPLKHKFDLPLGYASDDVLGVSRDSYEDAFIWSMDNVSGKQAYGAVDMVNKSVEGYDLSRKSANGDEEVIAISDMSLKQIGIDAARKALDYFKSQGISIQADYEYFYVLTSAGYVKINGKSTDMVLEGLYQVFGPVISENILPMHLSWKDLVFYFIWVNSTNDKDYLSYALRYDAANDKLIVDDEIRQHGDDMAYDMELYGKYSRHAHPAHHARAADGKVADITGKYNVAKMYLDEIARAILKDIDRSPKSSAGNVTATGNATNGSDDTANVTPNSEIVNKPGIRHSNPFNIVYTMAAVLIVCAIFGVSYSKRD